MRAWTVDADDLRVAKDFDKALLQRTIDAFLTPRRESIVIGTRDFGKTFVLRADRILHRREGLAARLADGTSDPCP